MSDLARCVGIPLKVDDIILAGEFCHYARVLIDVDLASQLLKICLAKLSWWLHHCKSFL